MRGTRAQAKGFFGKNLLPSSSIGGLPSRFDSNSNSALSLCRYRWLAFWIGNNLIDAVKQSLPHGEITEAIIGAAFEVHRLLGYGFLEAVYRNAMAVELRQRGLTAVMEKRLEVHYKSEPVGVYLADLLVNEVVLVELKVADVYRSADEAQLLNELAATQLPVGLLINFGRHKVEFKRLAWNLSPKF